jgi:hypothetical protein
MAFILRHRSYRSWGLYILCLTLAEITKKVEDIYVFKVNLTIASL